MSHHTSPSGSKFLRLIPRTPIFTIQTFAILACVAAFALPSLKATAQGLSPKLDATPRIVERIDEDRLTTLKGNTRPEARSQNDRGPVSPSLEMGDLILVLKRSPERQAAFEAFLASQQDPSSPSFHHWLTPDQIGEQFGPAQQDITSITQWLQNHNLSVTYVSKDHLSITFQGLAEQVQAAFHTEIHNLDVNGERHVANMSDPKIPEALSPVVVGVKALHNFFAHPMHTRGGGEVRRNADGTWQRIESSSTAASSKNPTRATNAPAKSIEMKGTVPLFGTGGTPAVLEDVAPYDFATIYNVLPLWNATTPIDGTGQTIAIAGTSNINLADVATFRSAFGLPVAGSKYPTYKAPKVIVTNTDPGDCSGGSSTCLGDLVENTLDVEWSGAVAKNAEIILVTSSTTTTTTDNLFASEQYIVDKVVAPVMNVSYGECELGLGVAGNTEYNTLWSTAQAAGIAVFVASGDQGSASCDGGSAPANGPYGAQYGVSVSGFSSTPYNTSVGGTDFNWNWVNNGQTTYWGTANDTNNSNALGYIPESPWNSTCSNDLLVAYFNSANNLSYTATQWCDYIGTQQVTFQNEQSALDLVNIAGGSGGASNCIDGDGSTVASCTKGYPKPSWQAGVTGIINDSVRDIPDVSFFAANGFSSTAYVICVSNPAIGTCSYSQATEPSGEEYGGTSISSPAMAGVMALVNQKAGTAQGNPNVELYKLAAKQSYSGCSSDAIPLTGSSCVFNDITTGTIAMPCDVGSPNCVGTDVYGLLSGYNSAAGYDAATGLGSLNVANFVNAYAAAVATSVTLSPTSLSFPSTTVGNSAATQTITLSNGGASALTVSGVTVTGTNASSFSETNNCKTVAAASSCTITVTFSPTAAGPLTASIAIADDVTGSPTTVALTGTGTTVVTAPAVSLSPTSLTFASTTVGASSAPQTVTLKNTGNASLTVSGVTITGSGLASFSQSNTCANPIAAGATCTLTVTFTPSVAGTITAALNIADNASGSPQSVSLTGTGVAAVPPSFTLAAPALTVTPGTAGSDTVTVTPANGYTGTVNLTCSITASPSGAVDLPTCTGGSATVSSTGGTGTVTIGSTGPTSSVVQRIGKNSEPEHHPVGQTVGRWAGVGAIAIAGLLFFGIPARRRSWQSILGVLVFIAGIGVLSGCGGGGSKTTNPGTTAGSYTVTVTGTDSTTSTITTTTTFTLTVN